MTRKITIQDEKLKKLITEKGEIVNQGRAKSEEIERIENEMVEIDKQIQLEESKVDIKDLLAKEEEQSKIVDACIIEVNKIKEEAFKRMKDNTPKELRDKYEELKKQKEDIETERNKFALKVSKYNDKIIPLTRKLMKPFLENEYEDYETIKMENGEIVGTIFNHLDEYKAKFLEKLNK